LEPFISGTRLNCPLASAEATDCVRILPSTLGAGLKLATLRIVETVSPRKHASTSAGLG
jgi:hypothetical protein